MRETIGDLWEYEADYRCITTNGYIKKNGEAVMGRGCAREAALKWPELPEILGDLMSEHGNHVQEVGYSVLRKGATKPDICAWDVIAFPVKHHWRLAADLDLIRRSAQELVTFIETIEENHGLTVVIPRPGCGNGQRDWETEVKPILEDLLDNRFVIITNETD